MIGKWTIGTMLGAAVLVALVAAVAQTRVAKESGTRAPATETQLAAAGNDLSGAWRLDPTRSDLPMRGGRFEGRAGRGGREKGAGGDAWNGREDRRGRGDRDGRGPGFRGRGRRLPAFLTVTQSGDRVQFADSTGALVQEIVIGSKTQPEPKDGPDGDAPRVRRASGQWRDGVLEVQRTTPRGVMTQTFALEDGGRTLVVRSARAGADANDGDRGDRGPRGATTLVYRKASAS